MYLWGRCIDKSCFLPLYTCTPVNGNNGSPHDVSVNASAVPGTPGGGFNSEAGYLSVPGTQRKVEWSAVPLTLQGIVDNHLR